MKLLFVLAFVACAFANVSESGYNYPQPAPVNTYIPPASPVLVEEPHNTYIPPPPPAPIEQPLNSYNPPAPVEQPRNTYIPAIAPSPVVVVEQPLNAYIPPAVEFGPAEDGYRYKTVRRVVYKKRT